MDYKARFRPIEVLNGQAWVLLSERERQSGALKG
jgi:arginyl-tRNA--protein-N-Asp/Glu arginylyltransferase